MESYRTEWKVPERKGKLPNGREKYRNSWSSVEENLQRDVTSERSVPENMFTQILSQIVSEILSYEYITPVTRRPVVMHHD